MRSGRLLALGALCAWLLSASTQGRAQPALFARNGNGLGGSGRIVGRVRFKGSFQRPAPLKVFKNHDFCGDTVPNESLLVGPQGELQNAVAILQGAFGQNTGHGKTALLDNKNCLFAPHVQVVRVGSELLLLNSDPILHDVHARLGPETLFNVGLPSWRQVKKRLDRPGIVAIECEVLHTWMSAYIVVTPSPHYAVTDKKGEFVIEEVPAGTYRLEVWHEKLGSLAESVTVTGGRTSWAELVFS